MRIAIAQIDPTVGDLEGNTQLILSHLRGAKAAGAALVVFPELAVSGYPPEDLVFKAHFIERCREGLEKVAPLATDVMALVGLPVAVEGGVANSASVLFGGRVQAVYHKIWLPNYAVFDERRYFVPGDRILILDTAAGRLAVNVCEDMWDSCGPTEEAALRGGADVVINLSMSPFHLDKGRFRQEMIRTRALDSGAFIIYANGLGGQDELLFDGQSLVFSPEGDMLLRGGHFREELLLIDLDPTDAHTASGVGMAPECWGLEVVELPTFPGDPPPSVTGAAETEETEEIQRSAGPLAASGRRYLAPELETVDEAYTGLCLGVRDYADKNGFAGVVLGSSGGIDSALTACIAADGLGAERVHLVSMPSQYTSAETRSDANLVAENLGAELIEIPIAGIFDAYLSSLAPLFSGLPHDVTEENIQARIRGNLLMALSNKWGWLVLATGNKSEMAVGYATLYGDMAGGFAALKDVPKTLVYRLAHFRNARTPDAPPIPESILTRLPSAELRPGQKDQETLPPYDVLDAIVEAYVVQDQSIEEITAGGLSRAVVEKVMAMIDGSEHKRRQAPPGVRITSRAFGKDRRLPITNRFRG